jgi:signal transduction histidine kinase
VILSFSGAAFLRSHYARGGLALVWGAAQAMPVVLARRLPILAWSVAFAASLVVPLNARPLEPGQPWPWVPAAILAYLVVQYAVAASRSWWVSLLTCGLTIGGSILVPPIARSQATNGNLTLITMLAAVALLGGQLTRLRLQARARVMRHERLSEEERAKRQLLEERARIARELHDVVAHHMSVIAVQAASADYRIDGLPAAARAEFESIGTSARDSLAEMRYLLSVLRGHDTEPERSPQPGVERLEEIAETARRAGTPVTLTLRDVPARLPDAVALSVYRIVQEALSNVIRHAAGAATRVEVLAGTAEIVVRVDNEPPPGPARTVVETCGGHGLVGMRERAAMLGGELVARPRQDGGFTVEVVLRLPGVEPEGTQGCT